MLQWAGRPACSRAAVSRGRGPEPRDFPEDARLRRPAPSPEARGALSGPRTGIGGAVRQPGRPSETGAPGPAAVLPQLPSPEALPPRTVPEEGPRGIVEEPGDRAGPPERPRRFPPVLPRVAAGRYSLENEGPGVSLERRRPRGPALPPAAR